MNARAEMHNAHKAARARLEGRPLPRIVRRRDFLFIASPPPPPPSASTLSGMGAVILEMVDVYLAEKKAREEKQRVPAARQIMAETCAKYGVPMTDILSIRRYPDALNAKHEAMWRIRRETKLTLPQIGGLFDNMHHASIKYAVNRFQSLIDAGEVKQP